LHHIALIKIIHQFYLALSTYLASSLAGLVWDCGQQEAPNMLLSRLSHSMWLLMLVAGAQQHEHVKFGYLNFMLKTCSVYRKKNA